MDSYLRDTCILCSSKKLQVALPLTPTPIADGYSLKYQSNYNCPIFSLTLMLCGDCGNVQLSEIVSPKKLFSEYTYKTSFSVGLTDHFKNYAQSMVERFNLKSSDKVLDIGSNNGALLLAFKQHNLNILGIDPAEQIALEATKAGLPTIPDFFNSSSAAEIKKKHGQFKLITANNVFAHSEFLQDMGRAISDLLCSDGVFVFEVNYLADIISQSLWDTVYHEHLCYHSIKPLKHFFDKCGLELFDVNRIPTKGGSLRCFVQHRNGPRQICDVIDIMIKSEADEKLHEISTYNEYEKQILENKLTVKNAIEERISASKKTIYGFGASATSTTLMYHYDLHQYFKGILDDNVSRHGLYTPGIQIPISPMEPLYDNASDISVVLLSWRFLEPIKRRHAEFFTKGGEFIVPLPKCSILN
jgi:hypothetical protein